MGFARETKPRGISSGHTLACAGALFVQTDPWNQSDECGISSFGPILETGTNNTPLPCTEVQNNKSATL